MRLRPGGHPSKRPTCRPLARSLLLPILLLSTLMLSTLMPAAAGAESRLRIATILVQGLTRVDRAQILEDLDLREGADWEQGLDRRIERRGRVLPYVKALTVISEFDEDGAHLTLRVREARRLNIQPFVTFLEDGDLAGGFSADAFAPLGRRERWRLKLQVGASTALLASLRDLRLSGSPWVPSLNFDGMLEDWDNPFWDAETRRMALLAGPSWRLPGRGHLLLLAGRERLQTTPNRSWDPDGKVFQPLFRGQWRQPLGAWPLSLRVQADLRTPRQRRGFAMGSAALLGEREQGAWLLSGHLESGLANASSPVTDIFYMDNFRFLWAYDAGDLPARQFHFLRLRGDLSLFKLPLRLSRNAPPEMLQAGPYLQIQGALLRPDGKADFDGAMDAGLGMGFSVPGRMLSRGSLGVHWNRDGEARGILYFEVG
jgi:hypothetical protein